MVERAIMAKPGALGQDFSAVGAPLCLVAMK
jgi:hypothetical protein